MRYGLLLLTPGEFYQKSYCSGRPPVNAEEGLCPLLSAQCEQLPTASIVRRRKSGKRFEGMLRRDLQFLLAIQPTKYGSHPPVIWPPRLNRLFDVRLGKLFGKSPFSQFGHLRIRGEAKCDELPFGQFRNSRAQWL